MRMISAVQAAIRPGLTFLLPVFCGAAATAGGARGGGCGCHNCLLSGQVGLAGVAAVFSWTSATVARMMNKITERALA